MGRVFYLPHVEKALGGIFFETKIAANFCFLDEDFAHLFVSKWQTKSLLLDRY